MVKYKNNIISMSPNSYVEVRPLFKIMPLADGPDLLNTNEWVTKDDQGLRLLYFRLEPIRIQKFGATSYNSLKDTVTIFKFKLSQ
jgi:hypothetical protein